jgi:hypothetical protein
MEDSMPTISTVTAHDAAVTAQNLPGDDGNHTAARTNNEAIIPGITSAQPITAMITSS